MNDLDVLRLHIPPLGFFDHFACPDQVVVVGNGPDFLLGAADLTPETTFCNLFVVQRSQQQGARDYLRRHYQDIHDARTQHYAEELGTAIMTWECPDNDYVLIGVFSDVYSAVSFPSWDPQYRTISVDQVVGKSGAQILHDHTTDLSLDHLHAGMGYVRDTDLYEPVVRLFQRIVHPQGLHHMLSQGHHPMAREFDADEILVVRYFQHIEREQGEEDESPLLSSVMQSIIDEHDLTKALETHGGGGRTAKSKM